MAKYGPKAKKKIQRVMKEFEQGKLKSGRRGHKVASHKQAVAIALSEARRQGYKVPPKTESLD